MEIKTTQKRGPAESREDQVRQFLNTESGQIGQEMARLETLESRIGWIRLAVIIITAISAYYIFSRSLVAAIAWLCMMTGIFLAIVIWHLRVGRKLAFGGKKLAVIQLDQDCLDGQFPAVDNGSGQADENHPYTDDLDIFGNKSLFQYINRTQTRTGADKLANALKRPAPIRTIRRRQEAVRELAPQWAYRTDFLALSRSDHHDQADFQQIIDWAGQPPVLYGKRWIHWSRLLVPPITIILFAVVIANYPLSLLIFILLLPGFFLHKFSKQITSVQQQTEQSTILLQSYAKLIRHIEDHDFESELLRGIHASFKPGDLEVASVAIRKLSYLIRQLNVRLNPFSVILNIFTLWDFHWVIWLEKWKEAHRHQLPRWIEALGEMDFLMTLANSSFLQPGWQFPEISTDGPIEISEVAHPLILQKEVVQNDLAMPGNSRIRLITGSNMAGKSTFLRTVGITMVMAYAGLPVKAKSCRIPLKHVFTSMRTKDNLQESTSSFYAELKRLRAALMAVQEQQDLFFLLDEILKGTNSVDRHTGSRALILQLLDSDGVGLIATHDLELSVLEKETGGKLENWSFDVEIRNGKFLFDYRIKRGVCSSFNATHLMQQMGFDLNYLKKNTS